MPFELKSLLDAHAGECASLYGEHVNPRFARALSLIGFDRCYVRGRGAHLWDEGGRKYLDMLGGYGMFNIGRNHPALKGVLREFLDLELSSLVQMEPSVLVALAARELKARVGYDLPFVYFGSTGAEAVETAMKFARRTTGRPRILHASGAFHGLTTGALSLNGSEIFREGFGPFLPAGRAPFDDPDALERELRKGDVAAFFVEPVQGKGVNIPSPGYLAEACRLCHAHGALFVADEVQTGAGRTGRFLALHHERDVRPDIIVMSKSLSGGFVPVSAVIMSRRVYDAVFSSLEKAVVHSSTFGKSSFAAAALLATLHVLDEEKLASKAEEMGNFLMERLSALVEKYEFLHAVRGRGLMIAIDFGPPRSLKLKTAWKMANSLSGDLFCQAVTMPMLEKHAVLTQVAGHHMKTIKLLPPLVMDEEDAEWFLRAFADVMEDLHRFPGPVWESMSRIAKNAFGTARKAS